MENVGTKEIQKSSSNKSALTASMIRSQIPLSAKTSSGALKSPASIKNIIAGFNQMLANELLSEANLKSQLSENFKLTLNRVREYTKKNETGKQWPSFLNDIRIAADDLVHLDTSKMPFSETLFLYARREFGAHLSKSKLATVLSEELEKDQGKLLSVSTIRHWFYGRHSPVQHDIVDVLDKFLRANGEIKKKLPSLWLKKTGSSHAKEMPLQLPPALISDMENYISWRMDGIPPKINELLSELGKSRDKSDRRKYRVISKPISAQWQTSANGVVSGKMKFMAHVRAFSRFIHNEKPEIYSSLRMSHFFDEQLLADFVSWIISRGIFGYGLTYLRWLKSEAKRYALIFIDPPQKYICDFEEWEEELSLLSGEIEHFIKEIEQNYEALDGARNVEWILLKENPHDYVNMVSNELWRNARYSPSNYSLTAARNALCFDIWRVCPIRRANMQALQYRGHLDTSAIRALQKEEVCALYFDVASKEFVVFCHLKTLKNQKSSSVSNIAQALPQSFNVRIEEYLHLRDQTLKKYNRESSFLWLPVVHGRLTEIPNQISQSFSRTTKRAIDTLFPQENVSYGINPHGMRHLAASLYLRDNPDDYTGLATLLMDNLETVIKIYAKRNDLDNAKKIKSWAAKHIEVDE